MKKLFHIISYLLDDYLLISLTKDWLYLFDSLPEFEVQIDNENKLHLISTHTIKNKSRLRDSKYERICFLARHKKK